MKKLLPEAWLTARAAGVKRGSFKPLVRRQAKRRPARTERTAGGARRLRRRVGRSSGRISPPCSRGRAEGDRPAADCQAELRFRGRAGGGAVTDALKVISKEVSRRHGHQRQA
ncbi:MAG TPA: hypothetical protein PKY77_27235 [Phycisphaerae bacterium]|nr:hypothetical protein [Phycisphaerae bacterium]HRY68574.1 hypothetical protein [Phycisphaerae bacterium]HSA25623.1 hypothetical protein [Phycisphaerae bacterium]